MKKPHASSYILSRTVSNTARIIGRMFAVDGGGETPVFNALVRVNLYKFTIAKFGLKNQRHRSMLWCSVKRIWISKPFRRNSRV